MRCFSSHLKHCWIGFYLSWWRKWSPQVFLECMNNFISAVPLPSCPSRIAPWQASLWLFIKLNTQQFFSFIFFIKNIWNVIWKNTYFPHWLVAQGVVAHLCVVLSTETKLRYHVCPGPGIPSSVERPDVGEKTPRDFLQSLNFLVSLCPSIRQLPALIP